MQTRELGWAVLNAIGAAVLFAGLGAWCGARGGHDDPATVSYCFAALAGLAALWLAVRWLLSRARHARAGGRVAATEGGRVMTIYDLAGEVLLEVPGDTLRGADLHGANLTSANLTSSYLEGADLTGADLTGASLEGADLTGASLEGADLHGASLEGAKLPWCSGYLLGQLLLRASSTHDQRRLSALVMASDRLGWCWPEYLALGEVEPVGWALGVLADYVVKGDHAPKAVRAMVVGDSEVTP